MAENVEKKKTTAKKSTTSTKKSAPKTTKSTAKKTTTKKEGTAAATKSTAKKTTAKTTTAKKAATAKKTTTATKKTTTAKKTTTKKATAGVKASSEKELKKLVTETVEEPKVEKALEEAKITKDEKVNVERDKKYDRRVDVGILLLIIGLFGLLITLYLTSTMELSHNVTNGLVIGSMALEVVGIIVILYNSFCK